MFGFLNKAIYISRLGITNVVAVAWYRCKVRSGFFSKTMKMKDFDVSRNESLLGGPFVKNSNTDELSIVYFSSRIEKVDQYPQWHHDPYTRSSLLNNSQHWSTMSDFNLPTGDVKVLWEPSRFEWLIKACWEERFSAAGTNVPIDDWLSNWMDNNPINVGVNWKCGQEVSIRVLHLIFASLIRHHREIVLNKTLEIFLLAHLKRVLPTIGYAKAQDNNHATTEAAALFCGGAFLLTNDRLVKSDMKVARKAQSVGRQLLEERVSKLILSDGAFSQYSVNYHRLMLDTLSFAECFRLFFNEPKFSEKFYLQAKNASNWLLAITDPVSGDAPNLGSNDGAILFNANNKDYRDFRPSIQLSQSMFCGLEVFTDHKHCLSQTFRDGSRGKSKDRSVEIPVHPVSTVCKKIGLGGTFAILKTPHDRFRPSQSDANHFDLWHRGINVIRDGGTFSYNLKVSADTALSSTGCHSTAEIDGRDQMPKISHFLYGNWLTPLKKRQDCQMDLFDCQTMSSAYKDYLGAIHNRVVIFDGDVKWRIVDKVSGVKNSVILRFRLCPSVVWSLEGNELSSELATISCIADAPVSLRLIDGIESRYYLQKVTIPVLEIKSSSNTEFDTSIRLI